MTTIVFSRDRAAQLEAFLRSYEDHVVPLDALNVLYVASDERHARAYDELFLLMPFAKPALQSHSFKADVVRLIPPFGAVVFFVDDQIFTRDWVVDETPGLSLRLAPHVTEDYYTGGAQPVPPFEHVDGRLAWRWADGQQAWAYPLSLDGHVFDAVEVRRLVEKLSFYSPNTLESALQHCAKPFLSRLGLCYREAKVVNVPWTRVQEDWYNRSAEISAETMLLQWERGLRIKTRGIYGVVNTSTHQEFPLEWEAR